MTDAVTVAESRLAGALRARERAACVASPAGVGAGLFGLDADNPTEVAAREVAAAEAQLSDELYKLWEARLRSTKRGNNGRQD